VDLFLDYSKNRVSDQTLDLLLRLAKASDLEGRIEAMFRGERINATEGRSVMHVALRAPKGSTMLVDGQNVVPEVQALPVPKGLSLTEAASLPETFFTVYSNVFDRGCLKAGETFLVQGGSSGIGLRDADLTAYSTVIGLETRLEASRISMPTTFPTRS